MKRRKDFELRRSEIPMAGSKDVRDKVVSGEPFTSSAQKRVNAELKTPRHEYPPYSTDRDLHSDTTTPKENDITKAPQAKDEFAGSSKKRLESERSLKRTFFDGKHKTNNQLHS